MKLKDTHIELAKFVAVVAAFAATADAFQSITLRSLPSHSLRKCNGISQHFGLNLCQRKSALTFINELRATGTLESERTYDVAQARAQVVDIIFLCRRLIKLYHLISMLCRRISNHGTMH